MHKSTHGGSDRGYQGIAQGSLGLLLICRPDVPVV